VSVWCLFLEGTSGTYGNWADLIDRGEHACKQRFNGYLPQVEQDASLGGRESHPLRHLFNTWNQQGGIAGVHSKLPSCFINPICQQRLQGAGLRCLCHVFKVRNSLRLTISTVLSETNP
jgi:hypothetical protein